MKSHPGPPMMLGVAAAAGVRLIVWCKECRHQVEPNPAEMATRYGAETSVLDWRERLVCSRCGGRQVDMVVTGTKRRGDQPSSEDRPLCIHFHGLPIDERRSLRGLDGSHRVGKVSDVTRQTELGRWID